nr:HNH endonuclease family protein [uncultured Desulfobacter sp.]
MTIEHVLPQTVNPDSEWAKVWPDGDNRDIWRYRIANLVPLTQKRNSKAQNYDFNKKKIAYFGGKKGVSSYILTTQVLNTGECPGSCSKPSE